MDGGRTDIFPLCLWPFCKGFPDGPWRQAEAYRGDAFLVYIEVYGYDNVKGQTEREMYRALMRIWEEIQLANRGNKIELIQDPQEVEEDKKPAILKWFLPQEEIPSGLKSRLYLRKNSGNVPLDLRT